MNSNETQSDSPSNPSNGESDAAIGRRFFTEREKADFSLVLGGPLFQLFLRAGLVKPSLDLAHRRVMAFIIITWLPLAVLTALEGKLLDNVNVPFLFDLSANVKFLIGLPILIFAELIVHRRARGTVEQFLERELIAQEDISRFEDCIARAGQLRNSVIVELALILIAFTGGQWVWRYYMTLPVATWYAVPVGESIQLTWSGYWYAFVSMPLVRFILYRWYFRLFIWYLFLWRVSRLRLQLNPLHPDSAGGLGFLGQSVFAFAPVLIAQSAFIAGLIGDRIWHLGAKLPNFKLEIAGTILFLILQVFLPLLFFIFQMAEAKRRALRQYGMLASRYASEFKQKWLSGSEEPEEPLLGNGDIQSLADLGNSYNVVREMRSLPFGKTTVLQLTFMTALPIIPLALTMMPIEELVQRLVSLIL
jgi:hypothetical protein